MEAFITLGGRPVVELAMGMPRIGVWWAQCALADNEPAPAGKLELDLNGYALTGSVLRSAVNSGTPIAMIAGGGGALSTKLRPKSYRQQTLRLILTDILGAAGDVVSSDSEAAVLGTIIPAWVIANRMAGEALASLVAYVDGAAYRYRPDGTLWVGHETWPLSSVEDVEELDNDPLRRKLTMFAPTPSVQPGETWGEAGQIGYVEHYLREGTFRTQLTFGEQA